MLSPTLSRSTPLLLALAAIACVSAPPGAQPPAAAANEADPAAAPLAAFAAQRIVVVPAQRLRAGDSLGWAARAGEPAASLRRLDDEIAFALGDRGLARRWMMASDAARALRRNPTFEVDPFALDVTQFLVRTRKSSDEVVGPVASQLRAIAALGEARYVLVPAELRFEPAPASAAAGAVPVAGAGRAMLLAVIVDTRLARIVWRGDVASDELTSPSPALAASLASRLADLFAPLATPGS